MPLDEPVPGPIDGLRLPRRAWKVLQQEHIITLDQLRAMAGRIERVLPGIGSKTAETCAQPCRLAHNNRRRDRGALLVDLIVHDRFNRKEASGRGIRTLADRMVANWVNEDRRAGRRVTRPLQECIEAAAPHTAIRCG